MLRKKGRIGVILITVFVAFCLLTVLAGCAKKGVNLKGAQIVIGDFSNAYDVDTWTPRNEDEEIQLAWRKKIQADNGFKMKSVELSGWDDYFQIVTTNIVAGNKDYSLYTLSPEWAMTLYKQGLLYPISDSSVKLTNYIPEAGKKTAYNKLIQDLFTFGGKTYGFYPGTGGDAWHGTFFFWNKRLLKEAGYDPDLLYDLQKEGTWTWDKFYEIAKATTRDINNDGITDIFAMPCDDPREIMNGFVFGNNGNFVLINSQGKFENGMTKPEFIEAVQFYQKLLEEGLMKPRPENSAWDWDFTEFFDSRTAMIIAPEWRKGQMPEMKDDYGFVFPPKGPRATNYRMANDDMVYVIPAYFKPEEVDIILKAADLWFVPSSDDWKGGHYWAFRDRRAVDESMAMVKDARYNAFKNFLLVPGFPHNDFCFDLFNFKGTAAQLVEQYAPRVNAALDQMNR